MNLRRDSCPSVFYWNVGKIAVQRYVKNIVGFQLFTHALMFLFNEPKLTVTLLLGTPREV